MGTNRRNPLDTGPFVPKIFDQEERKIPEQYSDVIKQEGMFGGTLIPSYSQLAAAF